MLHFASPAILEAVCEIHEWIGVILPWRDRFQKPAGKQSRTAESRRDTFVDLILSADVDFLADVAAGCVGIRRDGYRAAACVECIMRRRQPEAFVSLPQLPFLADRFLYACACLLNIFAAELVREVELVMISKDRARQMYPRYGRSGSWIPRRSWIRRKFRGAVAMPRNVLPRVQYPAHVRIEFAPSEPVCLSISIS